MNPTRSCCRGWLGSCLVACLLTASVAWAEAGVGVETLTTRLRDGVYRFDARIDYGFSEAALEALDNGVPLYLDVQVQVRREDAWFWEPVPVDRHLRYMIRYQPLSELFLVWDLERDQYENFATREAAVAFLGELSDLELIAPDQLEKGETYEVRLRAALDISALPLPMQPLAYVSRNWILDSGWQVWPLQP